MKRYEYNTNILKTKNDLSCYILGAFITDGCAKRDNITCTLSSSDKDWLEDIQQYLCPTKAIYKDKKWNCYTIAFHNSEIYKFLTQNECIPAKSLIVEMPNIPDKFWPDFLRGVIDGDGCVTISKRGEISCEIGTASKNFAEALQAKLKIFGSKMYSTKKNVFFKIRLNGIYAYHFLKLIYYQGHKLSMKRKFIKMKEIILLFEDKYKFNTSLSIKEQLHQIRQSTQSGTKNGGAKLSEIDVINIRNLYPLKKYNELAAQFGVTRTTIRGIVRRTIWKSIK